MVFRGRHAVRRALAQLSAEGVLARGEGNQHPPQPERIQVDYPDGSTSVPVVVHSPHIGDQGSVPRFIPVRPIDREGSEVLLSVEELLSDLDKSWGCVA